MQLTPTQDLTTRVLGDLLTNILPAGTVIVQAQVNRVPEPAASNFVVMNAIRRERVETNIDTYLDCAFTASIAIDVMTVTNVAFGAILLGAVVFGVGLTRPVVTLQISGTPGGVGTYKLSVTQGTVASEKMATGAQYLKQPTKVTVQLDVHGPLGADNAQVISTLFRDDYAVQFFRAAGFDGGPLYADDPKQMAFINDSQQYEQRWVVEAALQANQVVTVPQEFADQLVVGLIDVDAKYPA